MPAHLCQSDAGAGRGPGDDPEHGGPRGSGHDAALSACAGPDQAKGNQGFRPGILLRTLKKRPKNSSQRQENCFFNSSQTPVKGVFSGRFRLLNLSQK